EWVRHSHQVRHVAFHPGGRLIASASYDRTVKLWDVSTGNARTLPGHSDAVHGVGFSADGRLLASCGVDGAAEGWGLKAEPPAPRKFSLAQKGKWVHGAVFTPEGRYLLTANPDGTVAILKVAE